MFIIPPTPRDQWDVFCYYEKSFTPEECERIITLGNSLTEYDGVVDQNVIDPKVRKNKISWIGWSTDSDWIFQKLHEVVGGANKIRYGFDLQGFVEPLQFTKYQSPADHYDWHSDHGSGNFSLRKLSMTFQLSSGDAYTGCDLELANAPNQGNQEAIRGQGCGIVFPSFERHRVTPLITGTRYSLVAWVAGPPFR